MLCDVCFRMLRGQEGRIWKGTYDLHFKHHTTGKGLRRAAKMNCGICRVLYEELQPKVDPATSIEQMELEVQASLSVLNDRAEDLYRLDFKLRCDRVRSRRTFVLKKCSKCPNLQYTQFEFNTLIWCVCKTRAIPHFGHRFRTTHLQTKCISSL